MSADSKGFLKKPADKLDTSSSKSLRIDLELFEPDEHNSPEFNYKKLVHIAKVKVVLRRKRRSRFEEFISSTDFAWCCCRLHLF